LRVKMVHLVQVMDATAYLLKESLHAK
jgi:hypothetical protein